MARKPRIELPDGLSRTGFIGAAEVDLIVAGKAAGASTRVLADLTGPNQFHHQLKARRRLDGGPTTNSETRWKRC